jgi:ferredoxin-NADP reductase
MLRIIPYISKDQGRLSADFIKANSEHLEEKDIFICGPTPMMTGLRHQFLDLNIINSMIHTEEFNF